MPIPRTIAMNYRTSLHLLRSLLPSRGPADACATAREFMDTRPAGNAEDAPLERGASRMASQEFCTTTWAESAIDLAHGTEIMEFPDDTAADLMDQFFSQSDQRAA
jgi:hypothetical protein